MLFHLPSTFVLLSVLWLETAEVNASRQAGLATKATDAYPSMTAIPKRTTNTTDITYGSLAEGKMQTKSYGSDCESGLVVSFMTFVQTFVAPILALNLGS